MDKTPADSNSENTQDIILSWNSGEENLLTGIADRSNCMRWMHEKAERRYESFNFYLTVPSIIVSTLSGTATIGMNALPTNIQQICSVVIGLSTISIGVLTSINQYMKSSQLAESHRAASISYGRLHRLISAELAMRRDQRVEAHDFLKKIRAEQDRLQEISPGIPEKIIEIFKNEFQLRKDLEKPEIVGDLDHVIVNKSRRDGDVFATPTLQLP